MLICCGWLFASEDLFFFCRNPPLRCGLLLFFLFTFCLIKRKHCFRRPNVSAGSNKKSSPTLRTPSAAAEKLPSQILSLLINLASKRRVLSTFENEMLALEHAAKLSICSFSCSFKNALFNVVYSIFRCPGVRFLICSTKNVILFRLGGTNH